MRPHVNGRRARVAAASAWPLPEMSKPAYRSPRGRDAILVVGAVALGPGVMQKLVAAGFTLVRMPSAEEVHRLASDCVPAAILLAPSPDDDPFAVVRALRAQERLAFVQIFVFAEQDRHLRRGEGVAAGADDVFAGPCEHDEAAERMVARIARAGALAELALLDPLTGLHNRRFLNDRVPAEVGRATRGGTMLSLALLDLDGFKSINDIFGHSAGDRALVAFAGALRSGVRGYDLVCRFGGDEFVVLFPECGAAGSRAALSKLRALRSWALPVLPAITFSAGIAQFPDDGVSWTALFEVADQNVRTAKSRGHGFTIGRDRS